MRIDLPKIIHPPVVIPVSNPAAGATASYTLASNECLFIHSIRFRVANSAVAGNRYAAVEFQNDAGLTLMSSAQTNANIVNEDRVFYFVSNMASVGYVSDTRKIYAIPYPILLPPKWLIQILYTGMDAGDQLTAFNIVASRYFMRS